MWNQRYGGTKDDHALSLVATSDGGYALAGYTESFGAGDEDFWLVKADSSGNQLWSKTYGGAVRDEAYSLVQTGDGGYAVAGFTESFGFGGNGVWLVKTDASGNIEWNRTYGGGKAYSLVQTSDGGYALAGSIVSPSYGNDFYLLKTDADGNEQWNNTYRRTNAGEFAYSLVQTSDGGYALAGATTLSGPPAYPDFWLVKTNASGNMEWNNNYGGDGMVESMVQTSDRGYLLAGYTVTDSNGSDFWLVKTDASGNMEWNKKYGGDSSEHAYSLIQTSDGGYALAGYTVSFGAGDEDFWLVKIDSSGSQLWNKTYGGNGTESVESLVQTSDGGYALAGYTDSFGAGDCDFWLVKTDENGAIAPEPAPDSTPITGPTIDISCKGTATTTGLKVEITGKLSYNEIAVLGEPLLISYSVTGGSSWENLTRVNTGPDGEFSAVWTPPATGNYLIKAWWEGNATCDCFVECVNLALTPYSEQSIFSLTSNSTITEFAFNSTSKKLSFTASGPSDTTGYATVYIPKSLINEILDITVYLDGNQITYNSESQTDSWVLSFTYAHSAHKVVIDLSAAFFSEVDETQPPDFTIYIAISAVAAVIAVAVAALVFKRKRQHTPTQKQ